jgi:predicted transposase YdaD
MFGLSDLKQTRVYQEAMAEGEERGLEQGLERGLEREHLTFAMSINT